MTTIPTFEVIDLTPVMASEFLAGQAPNRNPKSMKIEQFARDMESGQWLFTGEAIKFDTAGRMTDGQNRCLACVKSGVTIRVLVIRGLDEDTQAVMDSGTPRSSRDALFFAGYERSRTKDISAAVSAHSAWKSGAFVHCMTHLGYHSRPTNSETVAYANEFSELVSASLEAKRVYNNGLKLPIGAIAVAMVETAAIDREASAEFFDRITNLRTAGVGDPVHTLLKRIDARRSTGQRIELSMALYLLFRSWNAYRAGEVLTKFQVGGPATDGKPATWAKIPNPQ